MLPWQPVARLTCCHGNTWAGPPVAKGWPTRCQDGPPVAMATRGPAHRLPRGREPRERLPDHRWAGPPAANLRPLSVSRNRGSGS